MSAVQSEVMLLADRMYTGQEDRIREASGIVIARDKIRAIGPKEKLLHEYPGVPCINLGNFTILPGLIDAHRHIVGKSGEQVTLNLVTSSIVLGVVAAQRTLEEGITTVRDPGCRHLGIFEFKRAIDDGVIPGPKIYAAGPNPTGRAAPTSWRNCYVRGPWSMRNQVRRLVEAGADWIKLVVSQATEESYWNKFIRFLTFEEIKAAVDESHSLGRPVGCHVEGLDAAKDVILAGVDAIEHGTEMDETTVKMMVDKNVFLIPTLGVFRGDREIYSKEQDKLKAYDVYLEKHRTSFIRALEVGVPVAAGTDAVDPIPPRNCLVSELQLMHNYGMSAEAVLRAATSSGAALLNLADQTGRLEEGLQADIIGVRGNPIEDIQSLNKVEFVMKAGKVYVNKVGLN